MSLFLITSLRASLVFGNSPLETSAVSKFNSKISENWLKGELCWQSRRLIITLSEFYSDIPVSMNKLDLSLSRKIKKAQNILVDVTLIKYFYFFL